MSGLGVDWDFNLLEALIQDRGDVVIWETALACPFCRREDATSALNETNPTQMTNIRAVVCDNCHDTGYIYRNAQQILGLLTSINAGNRELIDIGVAMPGDCVFSPSLNAPELHDMDKVTTCVADSFNEGQVIQRNAAHLSASRLRPTDLTVDEDRLWYAGTGCSIWCEDANNVVYNIESDYVIEDNKIRWLGNRPADGVFYTLKYYYYPEWIVYASPLERVDRARSLQQRVVLRKKHVAYTRATSVATVAQRQEEQFSLTGRMKI